MQARRPGCTLAASLTFRQSDTRARADEPCSKLHSLFYFAPLLSRSYLHLVLFSCFVFQAIVEKRTWATGASTPEGEKEIDRLAKGRINLHHQGHGICKNIKRPMVSRYLVDF